MTLPSGDRPTFDAQRNSSGSFPAAVSDSNHSLKFTEPGFQRFSPVNDPMEVEERDAAQLAELSDDSSRAIKILKETGSEVTEELSIWMPHLLSLLRHDDPAVVKQSITTGTSLFSAVLTEMALQLVSSSKIERWLEKLWSLMVQFKDAIFDMVVEPGSTRSKVYAAKFLENCFLLYTSDGNGEMSKIEGTEGNFNFSWLVQGHPILNPTMLAYEAGRILSLFFEILKSADMHGGILVITVINCLASIAMKRPDHYNSILSALLDFDPNAETSMRFHAASVQYAVRIALIGLVRCTHSSSIESKEKLLKTLRERYTGEITEHTIRQMEKLARSVERTPRDVRPTKGDLPSGQASDDFTRMRSIMERGDSADVSDEMPFKRARLSAATIISQPTKVNSELQDANSDAINSSSLNTSLVNSELSPAEKMIVAIGALLAEGEKGSQSLGLLLTQIHADLLADIVIETMKHLPNNPALSERNGSKPPSSHTSLSSFSPQSGPNLNAVSGLSSALSSEFVSAIAGSTGINAPVSDISSPSSIVSDVKRDPRRDPRRLDPRRAVVSVDVSSIPSNLESDNDIQHGLPHPLSKSTYSEVVKLEIAPTSEIELELSESLGDTTDQPAFQENLEIINDTARPSSEGEFPSDLVLSPVHVAEVEPETTFEIAENQDMDGNMDEPDQFSCPPSLKMCPEGISHDLPVLPPYIKLTNEQGKSLYRSAITRLIEDYKQIRGIDYGQTRLPLLARLFAQTDADDDLVKFFRKHIVSDYHDHEGHELALHVLYHLHAVMNSELDEYSSSATNNYEKFLMDVTTTLLDSLPASDKSFSKFLGDAPFLPKSALTLLEDLCQLRGYENHTKDSCDGDRVTQGLGAVWSLILGRPLYREACLDIALKCSIHSHDEVRTKAIRLVANKLFLLPHASESIEKFARSVMLSAVDQQVSEVEIKPLASIEQITQTGSQETSVSGSHYSDPGLSESEPSNGMQLSQNVPAISFLHAQQQTSLFFALCLKKPSLLHVVFDIYGRAQKVVKQSIHRHISGLVRSLGPSNPELLRIVSDPPDGSENLIMLVLQIMTEDSTPSVDLITAVKHLYDTKLKDVAILIPMLSSLSKDEVLPIFPRLVDLPLEKFQAALARILQGSAHTGPALTPVEVLVAIHEVDPVRDGVALKKITDACTACFEQRTVFTQQVLAKSLSHMVEQVPLPMLFMRTVIQAIGTFPALVDFVMEILSKLVNKQIWKMPKLWVGFLKLVSQTHPRSFNVLLQLPPPQLENALSKHANLRGPLAAYANQPNIRTSLTRETLQVLGLAEAQQSTVRSFVPAALHSSDTGSSVHSATLS